MNNLIKDLQKKYFREMDIYRAEKREMDSKILDREAKIAFHQRMLEKQKKKRDELEMPLWTEVLIKPVIEELIRLTPEIKWDYDGRVSQRGIRAACSFFGKTKEGFTVGVTLTHSSGNLYYDTGEVGKKYPKDTLGELNGMNNIEAPLESLDDLISLIIKQQKDYESLQSNQKRR